MKRVLAYLYRLASYAAFLGSILYLMGFLARVGVPKSVDSGTAGSPLPALIVDLLLIVLFGVQHSVMARPAFKRRWTKVIPAPLERSTFVLASSLFLILLCWQWRPLPAVVWAPDPSSIRRGQIQVASLRRTFDYYVPPALPHGAPLLLVLHGSGGSGARIRGFLGGELERLAREGGFIVAYPDGFEGHWYDCRGRAPFSANTQDVDDIGFVRELTRWFVREHGVDPGQVRAIGYSNGGHMAYRLALEAPRDVQAVVVFGANLPVPEELDCRAARHPVPIMIVNGTADQINPYQGGEVVGPGGVRLGRVQSTLETAREFAFMAGCTGEPERLEVVAPKERGDLWVERTAWLRPRAPGVILYTIHGGGHTIPGPRTTVPTMVGATLLGATERRFNAIEEAIHFFHGPAAVSVPMTPLVREPPSPDLFSRDWSSREVV